MTNRKTHQVDTNCQQLKQKNADYVLSLLSQNKLTDGQACICSYIHTDIHGCTYTDIYIRAPKQMYTDCIHERACMVSTAGKIQYRSRRYDVTTRASETVTHVRQLLPIFRMKFDRVLVHLPSAFMSSMYYPITVWKGGAENVCSVDKIWFDVQEHGALQLINFRKWRVWRTTA